MPRPNPPRSLQSEDNLAQRIAYEREQRGLTYEGLAQRLTDVGCPIQGSAIYKIEKGMPRRRIVVDELVALGKVFYLEITDLLVPVVVPAEALVDCDDNCGAPADPQTFAEYAAAYEHWRHHSMWSGCSHANI